MDQPRFLPPANPQLAMRFDALTEDQKDFWSERAAIREFSGGMSRTDAEWAAWLDTARYYQLSE